MALFRVAWEYTTLVMMIFTSPYRLGEYHHDACSIFSYNPQCHPILYNWFSYLDVMKIITRMDSVIFEALLLLMYSTYHLLVNIDLCLLFVLNMNFLLLYLFETIALCIVELVYSTCPHFREYRWILVFLLIWINTHNIVIQPPDNCLHWLPGLSTFWVSDALSILCWIIYLVFTT